MVKCLWNPVLEMCHSPALGIAVIAPSLICPEMGLYGRDFCNKQDLCYWDDAATDTFVEGDDMSVSQCKDTLSMCAMNIQASKCNMNTRCFWHETSNKCISRPSLGSAVSTANLKKLADDEMMTCGGSMAMTSADCVATDAATTLPWPYAFKYPSLPKDQCIFTRQPKLCTAPYGKALGGTCFYYGLSGNPSDCNLQKECAWDGVSGMCVSKCTRKNANKDACTNVEGCAFIAQADIPEEFFAGIPGQLNPNFCFYDEKDIGAGAIVNATVKAMTPCVKAKKNWKDCTSTTVGGLKRRSASAAPASVTNPATTLGALATIMIATGAVAQLRST